MSHPIPASKQIVMKEGLSQRTRRACSTGFGNMRQCSAPSLLYTKVVHLATTRPKTKMLPCKKSRTRCEVVTADFSFKSLHRILLVKLSQVESRSDTMCALQPVSATFLVAIDEEMKKRLLILVVQNQTTSLRVVSFFATFQMQILVLAN